MAQTARWELFCKIVDNFGDIGVCWRLARSLAETHGLHIRLWVDDMALAQRFAGAGHPQISLQHWHPGSEFHDIGTVVIEAFGCGLPDACQQAMLKQSQLKKSVLKQASCWINVDYLSAEAWVEDCHALPSPQASGLVRHFFYPGFTQNTGGLLREADLPQRQAQASWESLGLSAAAQTLNISLFCYDHAPLQALVSSLQHSPQAVRVLVPAPLADAVSQAFQVPRMTVGEAIRREQAEFVILPFLTQDDYDRLLALCDLNFVRGEDSWIRALWAGKPMLWLPYRQTEDTHLLKLEAFLAHYLQAASSRVALAVRTAMLAWAQGDWQATHWQGLLDALPDIRQHAQAYAQQQSTLPDLATNLVIFIEKLQKNRV